MHGDGHRLLLPAALLALLVAAGGCGEPSRPPADGEPAGAAGADTRRWSFGDGEIGTLPAGLRVAEGDWVLAEEEPGRGLLQRAENDNPVFNVVLIEGTRYADVDIEVDVHALEGSYDQGGGPVWRARDGENYYIARWNPLEDNYRVYKVVDGVRMQLASATTGPGSMSRRLRVRMVGSRIQAWLDGEAVLDVEDTTFEDAGAVGLWAKADARTLFSDLEVSAP